MSVVPADTPTRWFSLRRRLLLLLLGGIAAGWLAIIAASYADANREVDELLDAQMAQVAQTLLALAGEYDDDDDIAELEGGGHKYQKKFIFQIWDNEGRLLLRSLHAPVTLLAEAHGYSDSNGPGKRRWRYYSQWDKAHKLRVIVGENQHVRDELTQHIIWRMLALSLMGLPLLGIWVWFATRRGLAPIDAVTDQVARRAPDHLAAIVPAAAPTELRPLLDALNKLLARVGRAFENERRFTADAAHELRTPLAALSTQAQVVLRARDAGERDHAVGQLAVSARRASHLVDQLLTLSRLDPAAGLPLAPLALDALAAEICADHGSAALEKRIALELDATPAGVAGNAAMLRVLLRNLVDNALRYTPGGGRVLVQIGVADGTVLLTVSDSGPGIPVASRQAVLQRFHRLAGQDVEGSGLGLSIVARIAELHDARLELADGLAHDGGAGLAVHVRFAALAHA